MKRKVPLIFLTLACIYFLATGCTNYETMYKDQAYAIEEAFTLTADTTDNFYYFEYDDIEEQILLLIKDKPKNNKDVEYIITVSLPDLTDTLESDIDLVPEIYDLSNVNTEQYKESYINNGKIALEEYILDGKCIFFYDFNLHFQMEKIDGKWVTSVKPEELSQITSAVETEISEKANTLLDEKQDYKKLLVAEKIQARIEGGTPILSTAFSITEITEIEGGHTVTVEFPASLDVFSSTSQLLYDDYVANASEKYIPWEFFQVDNDFSNKLPEAISSVATMETVSFTVLSDDEYLEDFVEVVDKIKTAGHEKVSELLDRVNTDLIIQPEEKPSTKVLFGANSGQSVTIETAESLGDIFVTFYKLPGTDIYNAGTKALSGYIHGGDTLSVRLPAGNYKLIQGFGENWYGEEKGFGPSGRYQLSTLLIAIESGHYYTLTLYGVQGGNMPTTGISYPFS